MQKGSTSTPHDAVFKKFLRHTDTARDFLDIHLPSSLRQLCDLETLRLESASFIEEDLRACYSDVLWSLKTTAGEGYIYVVIEHQSSPDAHMAFRLMRYAIAAMQRHLDAGHKRLPLVIPMLFYHGIVQHRRVALLEFMQKHIRQRDLTGLVEQLIVILVKEYTNDGQLKTLFNYLVYSGDAPRFGRFIRELARRAPQHHKEGLMTIAERLQEVGRRKGKLEGRREGQIAGQRIEGLRIARSGDGAAYHRPVRRGDYRR